MFAADERELVIRAQKGDVNAFGELVRRHQSAVYNVAYRMTGNRRDAEDAAQETFLKAFRAFDRFDPERPLAPWLKRIAANLCLNWLQSSPVQTTTVISDMQFPGGENDSMDSYAQKSPLPEQVLINRETADRLRTAILQLPPIELKHFQDLSYDEMAETLARPVSSVKSDLFRARRRLGEMLEDW
jgi:RNA polymerase sigma-70 factor (ECF subfamily)